MSMRAVLEVIALDAGDAIAAQAGGADRLELVTDMAADGLTPPVATVAAIRAAVDIPLRVMVRLADGFAAGGAGGLDRLAETVRDMRAAGAEEFVFGFLDADGLVDMAAVERVVTELAGCPWTFHRAIDSSADRDAVRKQLDGLPGLDTYLTAGSAGGVDSGLPTLVAEAARGGHPGYEQRIMVGGGLRLEHVPPLRAAGIDAFHIGGAARSGGWAGAVCADAVAQWRSVLDGQTAPQLAL
ncbi:copper homeostasis protein CutC [Streptomyces sp. NPDC021356]|uniref:copper homeostasis protein CutC n=1 Tax=Streptomyces sp. NPDC021356 TaxID=3154900 RepID=UPI0033C5C24C